MGSRAGLDESGKPRPPLGVDPRAVQPLASRYTDYAIPAHKVTAPDILVNLRIDLSMKRILN